LTVLLGLQLAVAGVAGVASRALRQLDARVLDNHRAVIHYHERLDELKDEVSAAEAMDSEHGGDAAGRRVRAENLAALLVRLAQENPVASPEDLRAADVEGQQFQKLGAAPDDERKFENAVKQAGASLTTWRHRTIEAEKEYHRQVARAQQAYLWVESSIFLTPLFLLAAMLCINVLKRDARRQASRRENMEGELRRERAALEERIAERTAELQLEVSERLRAEQLNEGRNRILEMLTREEPSQKVLQTLVDVVARERSTLGCALHLSSAGALRMEAASGLPPKLIRKLKELSVSMTDAPEAVALRERKPQVMKSLAGERKPWPQLLYAYGVQSLWATPISTSDGTPMGTLTVYSLLQCEPSRTDLELLESHSQMASMVLERYRLQHELRQHAYHDSLTGLPNRLLGEVQLAAAIRRAARSKKHVAILWIDLDKFKQTNDVHGHLAGDAVLKEVAQRLSRRFRESDTIARMGGDEFMAVLEEVDQRSSAARMAEDLVRELALPIEFQGLMLNAAASIGVSMYPEDGSTADQLQRNADMAMYEAKFGRHGVRMFSPELESTLTERRSLEEAMTDALANGGFELYYQPQYRLGGELAGFEALLRFPHPILGMISPIRLIPIAEESQMIVALGSWVIREACRQSMRWQEEGYGRVPVAVNISAMEFVLPDFANRVAEALEETGMPADLLELELTESVMVKDFDESARQMERLKKLGVRIALDDFGTGYSSLNQFHRLPIDRLKIDRSFTQALSETNGSLPIIEGIVAMAHRMGVRVVAEGVETLEQMRTLRGVGCDMLQGYLLSQPLTADEAAGLLRRRSDSDTLPGGAEELLERECAGV
jgi:diguanylate cyclase (GGDEF)-like protein